MCIKNRIVNRKFYNIFYGEITFIIIKCKHQLFVQLYNVYFIITQLIKQNKSNNK